LIAKFIDRLLHKLPLGKTMMRMTKERAKSLILLF
jgi:hypothetical protein